MRVSVICVSDRPERLPVLAWSLKAQTHTDWELIVLDQAGEALPVTRNLGDLRHYWRVRSVRVPRVGDWGQTAKEQAARELASGEALMFPADDAYYVPTALEQMVRQLDQGADLALCGWLYSNFQYSVMAPTPRVGCVDVGGFMVRRGRFLGYGWPDKSQVGDGRLVEGLVASGAAVGLCQRPLYVKN